MEEDTIVAVATPPGRGAIGMVRISGPESIAIAHRLAGVDLEPRQATWCRLTAPSGAALDDAVVTVFRGPHSYTGEHVAELSCHGSPLILDRVVAAALAAGARPARAGEFTLRAFLNQRIDLTQAEAVADLVAARTDAGLGLALRQLDGELVRRVEPIRSQVLDVLAHVTALVEFSEEDIPAMSDQDLKGPVTAATAEVDELLRGARQGEVLRHGVSLAIIGPPNAGKSSILNRLLKRERAIVSEVPGTTRDTLEAELVIDQVVFHIADTAGLTRTDDPVETIGIQRSRDVAAESDLLLLVLDSSRPLRPGDNEAIALAQTSEAAVLIALNKCDLATKFDRGELEQRFPGIPMLRTSARLADGLERLRSTLVELALAGPVPDGFVLSNERHIAALLAARDSLIAALAPDIPLDLISLDLRAAAESLGAVMGIGLADEILDRVFSRFCIGK